MQSRFLVPLDYTEGARNNGIHNRLYALPLHLINPIQWVIFNHIGRFENNGLHMPLKTFLGIHEGPQRAAFVSPHIIIPEGIEGLKREEVTHRVMTTYKEAKIALNEAIADVAVQDEAALKFAAELAHRVLTLIDIAAELGLLTDHIKVTPEELLGIGVPQEVIDTPEREALLAELQREGEKTKIISETNTSSTETGAVFQAGFVGFSP